MITAERYEQSTSVEFLDVPYRSDFDRELAERLLPATREVAVWYKRLDPPRGWYNDVFKGLFVEGEEFDKFREKYLEEGSKKNSQVRSPYSIVKGGKNGWRGENMVKDPEIFKAIQNIAGHMRETAEWIDKYPGNPDPTNAKYLDEASDLLLAGRFDEALVKFVQHPPESNVRFKALPVEYWDDPMKDKASPQGLLAYLDREKTDQANADVAVYEQAFEAIYGEKPFPSWVFEADNISKAGALGVRNLVGFNIPNKKEVGKKAGHNVIYIHPNNIAVKNNVLKSRLLEIAGVESVPADIRNFTLAHEASHGYRSEGEGDRLVQWLLAEREGWAAARAVVGTDRRFFDSARVESVIRGSLAFAISDAVNFRNALLEPHGQNQPSLKELLADDGYTVDGYILTRKAIMSGAIGKSNGQFVEIDYDKIIQLSKERDAIYADLSRSGDASSAYQKINEYYEEKKHFNGYRKDFSAADYEQLPLPF